MIPNFGMKLFTGTAHQALANDIAACLDRPLADVSVTAFPDGETFVKINENIRGDGAHDYGGCGEAL